MNRRRLWIAATTVFWLVGVAVSQAQTRPEIKAPTSKRPLERSMYLGNSFFYYNNGLPGIVAAISRGIAGNDAPVLGGTLVAIGGSGFDWHDLETHFRPRSVGYYTFNDKNEIVFSTRAKSYDAVIMMDCSQCPIHPQLGQVFTEYAERNAQVARQHGAEPVLFMSWAYKDKPEMTDQLAEAYTRAGNANKMLVVPAGLAFSRVAKERPELNLYNVDKRHPSPLGSYLAAATVYASITGRSPETSTFFGDVEPAVARYLLAAAAATVRDYYGGRPGD